MSNFELCVCDMDGTLLDDNHEISKENEKALRKLIDKGVKVVIATGRVDLMIRKYIKQLNISAPVISCNGGLIRDISNNKVLYSKDIPNEIVEQVIDYCLGNKIEFLLYTTDMVYGTKYNHRMKFFEDYNKDVSEDLRVPLKYLEDKNQVKNLKIIKVLIVNDDKEYLNFLNDYFTNKYKELTVVSSANGLLDIMAYNIDKGEAVKFLAELSNIDLNKAIAFGDNYNDVSMLRSVGYPIAVANAKEEVKKVAKYITLSNNESGVAHAIYSKILLSI